MKLYGYNILSELDNLIGKSLRVITLPEEAVYGTGFIGKVVSIDKKYWDSGHYNVYYITLDFKEFEELNKLHDTGEFGVDGNQGYFDVDYNNGIEEYPICVKFDKHEMQFTEDINTAFFEVVE